MTIGGTTSATNAGTYTATFTPTEDYCWSDGSVAAKSVTWEINKAIGSVTLSSTNVELNPTYTSRTVTVSDATGTVSVSSNDTSVATASISGNTITINSVSNTSGSAIITVSVASSTNYNATSKTISVTASFVLDGETATPINDVQTWLKCDSTGRAMQQGSDITTLAEVIANSDVLGYLMSDESAMKYLARSTGFAEEACASETFMTALGASSWVDGTILNSDLWKQKIKASQYWTLVYASKTVMVYGGAYETITIDGYYGSFTTNADGSVSHVVPIDTITLTGSVSGQSFTRTITSSTTKVYVMPEGALYWYGNECELVTGGYAVNDTMSSGRPLKGNAIKETNSFYLNTGYSDASFRTNNKIDFSKYSTIHATITDVIESVFVRVLSTYSSSTTIKEEADISAFADGTFSEDVSTLTDYFYVVACCGGDRSGRFHAFWLE